MALLLLTRLLALDDIDRAAEAEPGVAGAEDDCGIPALPDELAGLAGALLDAYEAPLVAPEAPAATAAREEHPPAQADLEPPPPLPPSPETAAGRGSWQYTQSSETSYEIFAIT